VSGNEIAFADVRAETLTVASQFGAQVDLVIEASPSHRLTTEVSSRAVSAADEAPVRGADSSATEGRLPRAIVSKSRCGALGALVVALGSVATVAAVDGARAAPTARCSAASLPPARASTTLPRAVDSMRLRIVAAARRCDYAALVRLGNERGRGLAFSYGGTMSAPAFWRMLERNDHQPRPMEALVKLLSMPHATVALNGRDVAPNRARFYIWPRAHRVDPSAADWRQLRTLYSASQIERMRRGGSGYLGYRVGITPAGDWQFFIAGD
jgi:hypothetical protein